MSHSIFTTFLLACISKESFCRFKDTDIMFALPKSEQTYKFILSRCVADDRIWSAPSDDGETSMLIVSFVGQKGGVGKSALARVLAVAAARQSKNVLIADFDLEQLSCVEWGAARLRLGQFPEVEARAFKSLKKLRKTVEGFDLVVVDTRGLADELTDDVSKESDIVFLPTGTSMDDLRPTLALARKIARKTKPEKIVLILSKVGRSERQLEEARAHIENAGFLLLKAVWPQRDGFQAEFDSGRAGSEVSNPHLRQSAEAIEKAMLSHLFQFKALEI